MIRVVLTGGESTGKTDLAGALGAHFHAPVSHEYVREFAEQHAGRIELSDSGSIARGQMAAEDAAIVQARDIVILDTDLVSTVVYCEHYFGSWPAWIRESARERAGQLYLLCKPDIPWQPDGVRDRGDFRQEMHALFRAQLEQMGLRLVEIGGTREERFRDAVAAIDALRHVSA